MTSCDTTRWVNDDMQSYLIGFDDNRSSYVLEDKYPLFILSCCLLEPITASPLCSTSETPANTSHKTPLFHLTHP